MTNRQANQECTRLKKLVRERDSRELGRVKEAAKQNRINKKDFKAMQKEIIQNAIDIERQRARNKLADESVAAMKKATAEVEKEIEQKRAELAQLQGEDDEHQFGGPSDAGYDEYLGSDADEGDSPEEVIKKHVTRRRASGASDTETDLPKRRIVKRGSAEADILRRVGCLVTDLSRFMDDFEKFRNTMQNRHDVS